MALSCQPYLDHPLDDGFSAELHARGARRRLSLESVKVSPDSLLLVFNQPLRELKHDIEPPFEPNIRPPLAIKGVKFEGAAGLRIELGAPLPPASTYTIEIPQGWQSSAGSALTHSIRKVWTSPSLKAASSSTTPPSPQEPLELLSFKWEKGGGRLTFSGPVSSEELQRCLVAVPEQTLPRLDRQESAAWDLKFERGVPETLLLTEGLRDRLGRRLYKSVRLDVGTSEGVESVPKSQGWLQSPQSLVGPGEPMVVVGSDFTGECDRGLLTVHGQDGAMVWSSRMRWSTETGFVARFPAPSRVGRYQVSLKPVEGAAWRSEFQVCPVAERGESYRLEFVQAGTSTERVKLEQAGPQHRDIRLRAYLTGSKVDPGFPSEWARTSLAVPNWTLLAETSDDELSWSIPKTWNRSGVVVIEALDRQSPELLLARAELPVVGSRPSLTLRESGDSTSTRSESKEMTAIVSGLPSEELSSMSVSARLDYRALGKKEWEEVARHEDFSRVPWRVPTFLEGRYRLRLTASIKGRVSLNEVFERKLSADSHPSRSDAPFRVERADQRKGAIRVGEPIRLTGQPDTVVGLIPSERMEQQTDVPGPERFPLLLSTRLEAGEVAGWRLDRLGSTQLIAPEKAGAYGIWFFSPRSKRVKLEEAALDVEDVARWEVRTPVGVRVGDRFQAGLDFFPGPLTGAVGLTAAAHDGNLLPTGYYSTAAVAKGKTQRVLFDYEVPSNLPSPLRLNWTVGHSGYRQQLSEQVLVWPQSWTPRLLAKDRLGQGQVRRFTSDGAWRLVLSSPAVGRPPAKVAVETTEGGYQSRTLAASDPPWTLGTKQASLVRLEHRGGGPIFYQWSRLELDEGNVSTWSSRAYLETLALNGDGSSAEHWSQGKGMAVLISLVNPKESLSGLVRLPLPSGVEPQSLQPWNEGAKKLPWSYEEGVLQFRIQDLPAGEFLWKVTLEARSTGDFLWPSAQLVSPQTELWALSGSSRMEIRP